MADAEDPAKAEKLAAAKKRYEQLKKKGKKGATKSGSTASAAGAADKVQDESGAHAGTPPEDAAADETAKEEAKADATTDGDGDRPPSSPPDESTVSHHNRNASLSQHRRTSSTGFRRPSISAADLIRSGGSKSPLSPTETLPDIYRKQAATISELTEKNEKLEADLEKLAIKEKRLVEVQAEKDDVLEQLAGAREALRGVSGRVAEAEAGSKKSEEEMEDMKSELAALNRQCSHLMSQLTQKDKTISELRVASSSSSNSQDREALTAKEEQIENMSMDLNKLRTELEQTRKSLSDITAELNAAKSSAEADKAALEYFHEEQAEAEKAIEALRSELAQASEQRASAEAQLRTAQADLDMSRTESKKKDSMVQSWEKDYNTLKTMYKDADAKQAEFSRVANDLGTALSESRSRAAHLESENQDLRLRLDRALAENRKLTGTAGVDDDDLEDIEDAERRRLRERVVALEKELEKERRGGRPRGSTILGLGLGAGPDTQQFIGEGTKATAHKQAEMEAMRKRAEEVEEERRKMETERMQRVRETKKGLEKWKGWRLDLTTAWGSGVGVGPMFEV